MGINRNYVRFVDGTMTFAPNPLDWDKVHVETYPEIVFDEETGEERETGETLTSEWTETKRIVNPSRDEYSEMEYYRLLDSVPAEPAGDGMEWKPSGPYGVESSYGLVSPEGSLPYYRRLYSAVAVPVVEEPPAVASPRKWSRLSVLRGLKAAGLWSRMRAKMTDDDIEEFLACDYILEDDPLFASLLSQAKEEFGAETVEGLLLQLPQEK